MKKTIELSLIGIPMSYIDTPLRKKKINCGMLMLFSGEYEMNRLKNVIEMAGLGWTLRPICDSPKTTSPGRNRKRVPRRYKLEVPETSEVLRDQRGRISMAGDYKELQGQLEPRGFKAMAELNFGPEPITADIVIETILDIIRGYQETSGLLIVDIRTWASNEVITNYMILT